MRKFIIGTAIALIATLTIALGGRAYCEHNKGKNFAYDCGLVFTDCKEEI